MPDIITGRAHKYGDNINTDIISPPAYMELSIEEAAKYAMSPVDPDFAAKFKPGDILVAERNFGSGSSRETAPLCLRELGVRTIVAQNFARIFYRNAINLGILALECRETPEIADGDVLSINVAGGKIENVTQGASYSMAKIPAHLLALIEANGLIPFLEKRLGARRQGGKA